MNSFADIADLAIVDDTNSTTADSLRALSWRCVAGGASTATNASTLLTPIAWQAISRAPELADFCRLTMARDDQVRLLREVCVWYPPVPGSGVSGSKATAAAASAEGSGAAVVDGVSVSVSGSGVEEEDAVMATSTPRTPARQLYYAHRYNDEGQLHGVCNEYWPNGTLSSVRTYANGVLDGESVWYNSEGQEKMKFNYKDGKRHGEQQEWYRNGKQHTHYWCKDGLRDGVYKGWFKSGVLEFEYNYCMGELHGEQKEFHRTSNLYLLNNFNMGKREGVWNTWYETGAKSIISFFKDDLAEGKKEKYNKAGNMLYMEEWLNGKKHGIFKEFGSYNNIIEHKRWENGVCVQDLLNPYRTHW